MMIGRQWGMWISDATHIATKWTQQAGSSRSGRTRAHACSSVMRRPCTRRTCSSAIPLWTLSSWRSIGPTLTPGWRRMPRFPVSWSRDGHVSSQLGWSFQFSSENNVDKTLNFRQPSCSKIEKYCEGEYVRCNASGYCQRYRVWQYKRKNGLLGSWRRRYMHPFGVWRIWCSSGLPVKDR